jgi:16S rRNA (guanine527-N7)-methyltransferase
LKRNLGLPSKESNDKPAGPIVDGPAVNVKEKLTGWFPDLSPEIVGQLVGYYDELIKFNKSVNLISAGTVKNAEVVHVADAVFACRMVEKAIGGSNPDPIYDFGSGNGCPGVIYATLNPSRRVILVDRDERKMEFCKHVAASVGLKNLSVMVNGVEELPPGSVSLAISRGFAPFSKALLIVRKQIKKGGRFFHMKGDGWSSELAQTPSQVFSHWAPNLLGKYKLPEVKTEMFVITTEKTAD